MSYIKDKGNTIAEEYDRAVKNIEDGMKDECFPGRDLHMTEAFEFILEHMDHNAHDEDAFSISDDYENTAKNEIYKADNHEDLYTAVSDFLEYANTFAPNDNHEMKSSYEEEKCEHADYVVSQSSVCPNGLLQYNQAKSIDEYIKMRESNPVKDLHFSSDKQFNVQGNFKLNSERIDFTGDKLNLRYSNPVDYDIDNYLSSYVAANAILSKGTAKEAEAIANDINNSTINFIDVEDGRLKANVGNQFNTDVTVLYDLDLIANHNLDVDAVYFDKNIYAYTDSELAVKENVLELMHDDMSYIYDISFDGNKFKGTAGDLFSIEFEGKVENDKVTFTKNEKAAKYHALSGQVLDAYKDLQKTETLKKQQNLSHNDKEIGG